MPSNVLTRDEIVSTVSKQEGLVEHDVKRVLEAVVNLLYSNIASGRRVALRRFGLFLIKERKGWTARDPRLPHGHPDEWVEIPDHSKVVFRPCHALKMKVIRAKVLRAS